MRRLLHEETIVVEFEPTLAKRSLPRLAHSIGDRRKLHALFDALERESLVDERQRALIVELRRLLPIAGNAAARTRPRRNPVAHPRAAKTTRAPKNQPAPA